MNGQSNSVYVCTCKDGAMGSMYMVKICDKSFTCLKLSKCLVITMYY